MHFLTEAYWLENLYWEGKDRFMKSADQLKESVASAISSGRISSAGGNLLVLSSISSLIGDLEKINPIEE